MDGGDGSICELFGGGIPVVGGPLRLGPVGAAGGNGDDGMVLGRVLGRGEV
jgi:hypothetical protein